MQNWHKSFPVKNLPTFPTCIFLSKTPACRVSLFFLPHYLEIVAVQSNQDGCRRGTRLAQGHFNGWLLSQWRCSCICTYQNQDRVHTQGSNSKGCKIPLKSCPSKLWRFRCCTKSHYFSSEFYYWALAPDHHRSGTCSQSRIKDNDQHQPTNSRLQMQGESKASQPE